MGSGTKNWKLLRNSKKNKKLGDGGRVGVGQGGGERRIEVVVEMPKKSGGGGGVRVDVNEELKLL